MASGVLLVHFGEPPQPERPAVESYLANIFERNAELEDAETDDEARERAAQLARRRAPELVAEYEAIGGSPLNRQAAAQAATLADRLGGRDRDVRIEVAFQYLHPTIAEGLATLREAGVDRLVVLPIYPLCGPSTTIAALHDVRDEIEEQAAWDVNVSPISGWHRHPGYLGLRARNLRSFLREEDVAIDEPETTLLFSAHGTPRHYLDAGSRYVAYVEEICAALAHLIGVDSYTLGYQNHENRDIPWTEPAIEDVLADLESNRVVVEPVSFMHEQSETLSELDIELAAIARGRGIAFHRVPVPHDDPTFPTLLADLVEPFLAGVDPELYQFRACECAASAGAYCLNAPRG